MSANVLVKAYRLKLYPTIKQRWSMAHFGDHFFPSTQACSHCGAVKAGADRLRLHQRTYRCAVCGHVEDRDLNAAQNLRRVGLQSLSDTVGQALPEPAGIHPVPPPHARRETRSGARRRQERLAETETVKGGGLG